MSDVVTYAKDLAERAGWTFIQGAASTFAVAQVTNLDQLKSAALAAGVAGGAAVLSLVKGVLAGTRTGTASSIKQDAINAAVDAGNQAVADALTVAQHTFPMP